MTETVVYATVAAGPEMALMLTQIPGWVGPFAVVVLGLAMLSVYVRRLLFTQVEEAVLVPEARTRREPPSPERYRLSGHLLRFSRYGGRW